jgi:hypothetical protein
MNGFDPFGLGPDADTDFLGPPPWDEDPPPPRKPNNPEGINQWTYKHRHSEPKHKYGESK